jgi:hypothetical protein
MYVRAFIENLYLSSPTTKINLYLNRGNLNTEGRKGYQRKRIFINSKERPDHG